MKMLRWAILLILCSGLVSAEYVPNSLRWELKSVSVEDTPDWILDNIQYQYYYSQRSVWKVWETKEADCTGMNKIFAYKLKESGVRTSMVHGMAYCLDGWYKHDWLEDEDGNIYDVLYWCDNYEEGRK